MFSQSRRNARMPTLLTPRAMRQVALRRRAMGGASPFDLPVAFGGPETSQPSGEFQGYLDTSNPSRDSPQDLDGVSQIVGAGAPPLRVDGCVIEQAPFALQGRYDWSSWQHLLVQSVQDLPSRPITGQAVAVAGSIIALAPIIPVGERIETCVVKLHVTAPTLTTTTSSLLEIQMNWNDYWGRAFNLSSTGAPTDTLVIRPLTTPIDFTIWFTFPRYVQTKLYPTTCSLANAFNPGGIFAVPMAWNLDIDIVSTLPDGTVANVTVLEPQHSDYFRLLNEAEYFANAKG